MKKKKKCKNRGQIPQTRHLRVVLALLRDRLIFHTTWTSANFQCTLRKGKRSGYLHAALESFIVGASF